DRTEFQPWIRGVGTGYRRGRGRRDHRLRRPEGGGGPPGHGALTPSVPTCASCTTRKNRANARQGGPVRNLANLAKLYNTRTGSEILYKMRKLRRLAARGLPVSTGGAIRFF